MNAYNEVQDLEDKIANLRRRYAALERAIQENGTNPKWREITGQHLYREMSREEFKHRSTKYEAKDKELKKRRRDVSAKHNEMLQQHPASVRKLAIKRSTEANRTNRIRALQVSSARARNAKLIAARKRRPL